MTTQTERIMAMFDDAIESARLQGGTDAKKGFGIYTEQDSRFNVAMHQSIAAKRAALLAALQEQAREGGAVANSAILARGRFHAFKGEDGEPDDWEWFEEGTNCAHGCIDAVIVRADAISAPQPAQPTLKWCDQCGEGVTDFCRGKGGKCAYGVIADKLESAR